MYSVQCTVQFAVHCKYYIPYTNVVLFNKTINHNLKKNAK